LEVGEYPISNSRSEAETGFREAEAVTAGNGNEYPISKERHWAIHTGMAEGCVRSGKRIPPWILDLSVGYWILKSLGV
jgi:hypothetical protein